MDLTLLIPDNQRYWEAKVEPVVYMCIRISKNSL